MTTFIDLLKDFIDTARERIKSPFITVFVFALVAYNWKPIFILLLSNLPIENRIEYLDLNYSHSFIGYLIPLLITLLYLTAPNYIMWGIDFFIKKSELKRNSFNKTRKVDLIKTTKEISKSEINAMKEVAELEIELEIIKAKQKNWSELNSKIYDLKNINTNFENDILDKDGIIEELKNKITSLNEHSDIQNQSIFAMNNVSEQHKIMYSEFRKSTHSKHFREVVEFIYEHKDDISHLQENIWRSYENQKIIQHMNNDPNSEYMLTKLGKLFWQIYNNELIHK